MAEPDKRSGALARCHSLDDLRRLARRRLPRMIYDFLEGGSESEGSVRRNGAALDEALLVPRSLRGVAEVRTATRLFGQEIEWPLICAPTGASRAFHPDGELAVARAAARAGVPYCLSTGATHSIEEVAGEGSGPKVFQIFIHKDRGLTWELAERCRASGYAALCLTVDVPVVAKRERDLYWGFSARPDWNVRSLSTVAARPAYAVGQLRRGPIRLRNFATRTSPVDPGANWDDLLDLAGRWNGPLAVKGIMRADDACRAIDSGATAIIVSNHGGRQLDGCAAPFDVLPEIVDAAGGRAEIIVDGGIRRGTHVAKALAAGATACAIGRGYLYGLAAGGEPGVDRALAVLRKEFVMAMQLMGCADLSDLDRTCLRNVW